MRRPLGPRMILFVNESRSLHHGFVDASEDDHIPLIDEMADRLERILYLIIVSKRDALDLLIGRPL